jgi:hypothetical protein
MRVVIGARGLSKQGQTYKQESGEQAEHVSFLGQLELPWHRS